jgi:hypothetical protein
VIEISFSDLVRLVECEAVYQITARSCGEYGLMLSREQFLSLRFTINVNCDGLIALARAGSDVRLLLQKLPARNGKPMPPDYRG